MPTGIVPIPYPANPGPEGGQGAHGGQVVVGAAVPCVAGCFSGMEPDARMRCLCFGGVMTGAGEFEAAWP